MQANNSDRLGKIRATINKCECVCDSVRFCAILCDAVRCCCSYVAQQNINISSYIIFIFIIMYVSPATCDCADFKQFRETTESLSKKRRENRKLNKSMHLAVASRDYLRTEVEILEQAVKQMVCACVCVCVCVFVFCVYVCVCIRGVERM